MLLEGRAGRQRNLGRWRSGGGRWRSIVQDSIAPFPLPPCLSPSPQKAPSRGLPIICRPAQGHPEIDRPSPLGSPIGHGPATGRLSRGGGCALPGTPFSNAKATPNWKAELTWGGNSSEMPSQLSFAFPFEECALDPPVPRRPPQGFPGGLRKVSLSAPWPGGPSIAWQVRGKGF